MPELFDFCTDCGWVKPIAHSLVEKRKDVKLCAECKASRERAGMPMQVRTADTVPKQKLFGTTDQILYFTVGLLLGIGIGAAIIYNIIKVT